jgi:hypothetical protein
MVVTDDDVPLVVEARILSAYEVLNAGESDNFGYQIGNPTVRGSVFPFRLGVFERWAARSLIRSNKSRIRCNCVLAAAPEGSL